MDSQRGTSPPALGPPFSGTRPTAPTPEEEQQPGKAREGERAETSRGRLGPQSPRQSEPFPQRGFLGALARPSSALQGSEFPRPEAPGQSRPEGSPAGKQQRRVAPPPHSRSVRPGPPPKLKRPLRLPSQGLPSQAASTVPAGRAGGAGGSPGTGRASPSTREPQTLAGRSKSKTILPAGERRGARGTPWEPLRWLHLLTLRRHSCATRGSSCNRAPQREGSPKPARPPPPALTSRGRAAPRQPAREEGRKGGGGRRGAGYLMRARGGPSASDRLLQAGSPGSLEAPPGPGQRLSPGARGWALASVFQPGIGAAEPGRAPRAAGSKGSSREEKPGRRLLKNGARGIRAARRSSDFGKSPGLPGTSGRAVASFQPEIGSERRKGRVPSTSQRQEKQRHHFPVGTSPPSHVSISDPKIL